jgi:hypothetical protein
LTHPNPFTVQIWVLLAICTLSALPWMVVEFKKAKYSVHYQGERSCAAARAAAAAAVLRPRPPRTHPPARLPRPLCSVAHRRRLCHPAVSASIYEVRAR